MKRLLATISIFLVIPVICAVAGCNTMSDDGWVEVQSITYTTDKGTTTLTSQCEWDTITVDISQSEYDNAPDELKPNMYEIPPSVLDINIDRIAFKTEVNSYIGNIYYYYTFYTSEYKKSTYTDYALNYVKVKIISDKVIEIDFKDEVKQISTLSYEITYFKN